ncbi:MAG TPA: hypothetical protein VMV47_07575 [Bacteroidales bacterium]|nr:hypothetical protein [Bacteroidales bacterium]
MGGTLVGRQDAYIEKNLVNIIYINFTLVFVGIIFYFIRPNFFLSYQSELFPQQFNYYAGYFPRLTSYMSSLVIGVICSTNFILSIEYIKDKWIKYIFMLTFAVGSFLSMERGSWVMLIFGTILFYLIKFYVENNKLRRPKLNKKLLAAIIIIVIIFFGAVYIMWDNVVFSKFIIELGKKVARLFNAYEERIETWKTAINLSIKYPFGLGLGILSHKGIQNNFIYSVADGNYFRILGDIGYLGLINFLILVFAGLLLLYKKRMMSILISIIVFLMQAIGTNVFDLYYISFLFWFFLGIAYAKKNHFSDTLKENI